MELEHTHTFQMKKKNACFQESWIFKMCRETECDEENNISQLMRFTGNKLVAWLGMKRASWKSWDFLKKQRGEVHYATYWMTFLNITWLQNIGDLKTETFRGCEETSVSNGQKNNGSSHPHLQAEEDCSFLCSFKIDSGKVKKTVLWSDESEFKILFGNHGCLLIRATEERDHPACDQCSSKASICDDMVVH